MLRRHLRAVDPALQTLPLQALTTYRCNHTSSPLHHLETACLCTAQQGHSSHHLVLPAPLNPATIVHQQHNTGVLLQAAHGSAGPKLEHGAPTSSVGAGSKLDIGSLLASVGAKRESSSPLTSVGVGAKRQRDSEVTAPRPQVRQGGVGPGAGTNGGHQGVTLTIFHHQLTRFMGHDADCMRAMRDSCIQAIGAFSTMGSTGLIGMGIVQDHSELIIGHTYCSCSQF
jgi:hypothetical protein